MSILRESYLYHLWAVLCTVYYDSAVHRCLVRMGAWCNRQIDESRVLRVLCREGVAARAWEESILCRLLTGLINLPAWLLHKLYLALRATFDDSVFSRLAFEMGHETAVAQSWLIMLLWVIPFSHWNNAYSMLGFAALLVLFYAGAMSRRDFRLDVKHIGFYPVVLFGAMFLAVLCGLASPLKSSHILWINLITDCFPALALGMEEAEDDIMERKPREAKDGIFSGGLGTDVIYQGILISALTLAAYFIGHRIESGIWEIAPSADGITMAFLTMSMTEIFHSFNMRSQRKSVFSLKGHNKVLWGAMLFSLVLTTLVIYVPFLSRAFGFEHISLMEYITALLLAFLIIPAVEIVKWIQRHR